MSEVRSPHVDQLADTKLWVSGRYATRTGQVVVALELEYSVCFDHDVAVLGKRSSPACIKALEKLATSESNDILANALAYYRKNKFLTPKYAFVVLWRLGRHRIDHSPSFFKVNLSKQKFKDDLRAMELSKVHVLWPALTSSQRESATQMGHTAP
ncbi:hypothetical protein DBA29_27035 [Xenophilus aerolatus]|nr:hypothetical protein [Xenophilus aerolatus]